MICSLCGGHVTWRGPLFALTYTQCGSCGGRNCQEVEAENSETDDAICTVCEGLGAHPTGDTPVKCGGCNGTGHMPNVELTGSL